MKKVSVIVPAWNCGKYLNTAIDSLLNQTYKNIEIIVVYDHSHDNTLDVIRSYGDKVIPIENQKKVNLAHARNIGLSVCNGDYICFLDGDDLYHPEKIELQVFYLDVNPSIMMVYCDVVRINDEGLILNLRERVPWTASMKKYWIRKRFICISSILFRKSVIDDIGKFDDKLDFAEDMDFQIRLWINYRIANINEYLMYYRVHSGQWSRHEAKNRLATELVLERYSLPVIREPRFRKVWIFTIRFIEKYLLKDHKYYTGEPLRETWKKNGLYQEWNGSK